MEGLDQVREGIAKVRGGMVRVIMGQEGPIEQLLTCFLAGGHVLLEGVPGLGKTLLARTLAKPVDARFKRIQFTPDLLPSDIVGTNVFNLKTTEFSFHKGPVFTEILLADEINRTPPKSQAALLEAMEERQVTVDGVKHPLPEIFFVAATQNPIEHEGTYPLPETQLDRFMMKIVMDYPSAEAELAVLQHYSDGRDLHELDRSVAEPAISREEVLRLRGLLPQVVVKGDILKYIREVIAATRDTMYAQLGASPRAAIATLKAARALAVIRGMSFVTPDEVKDVVPAVLRHRVILRPEALLDGLTADYFLANILRGVPVPR